MRGRDPEGTVVIEVQLWARALHATNNGCATEPHFHLFYILCIKFDLYVHECCDETK